MKPYLHIDIGMKGSQPHSYFAKGEWKPEPLRMPEQEIPLVPWIESLAPAHAAEGIYAPFLPQRVPVSETQALLSALRRLLLPGGVILTSAVDLQALGEAVAVGLIDEALPESGNSKLTPHDLLYGHPKLLQENIPYAALRSGFTALTLGRALRAAEFGNIHISRDGITLWAMAHCPPRGAAPDGRIQITDTGKSRMPVPGHGLADEIDTPPFLK